MTPHRPLPRRAAQATPSHRRLPARPVAAVLAAALGLAAPAAAQQGAPLTANDPEAGANLGLSVDVDGDTAIVGAPDAGGTGAAYVFVRSGTAWVQQAKLTASDGMPDDRFGEAVAVDGDHAIVGAPDADLVLGANTGVAYVFARSGTTWTEVDKLSTLFGTPDDGFGTAVDVEGDRAVVGSPFGDGNDVMAGAVYVYERSGSTWPNTARVFSLNSIIGDRLGEDVSLSGDTLAVSAVGDDIQALFAGAAYVFTYDGSNWTEQARLEAFDPFQGHTYGRSVAVDGDRLAVGATGDADRGSLAGAVYVYERQGTTWSFTDKLQGATTTQGDQFGYRVALEGDVLAVGSFGDDGAIDNGGSVTVIRRTGTTWAEQVELFHAAAGNGDQLGRDVALSGSTVLGGAPFHDVPLSNAGLATAWDLASTGVVFYCTGKTSSVGCVPFLTTTGLPSASSTTPFQVVANDVVPGEAGFVIYGFKKANLAFHGARLCVKAPFVRTPAKSPKNPGGGCSGWVLRRNFNATIQSGTDPALTPGRVVTAQVRQRDPADPAGFGDGLTDGVRFTIAP